jgi:hypothetical protein
MSNSDLNPGAGILSEQSLCALVCLPFFQLFMRYYIFLKGEPQGISWSSSGSHLRGSSDQDEIATTVREWGVPLFQLLQAVTSRTTASTRQRSNNSHCLLVVKE